MTTLTFPLEDDLDQALDAISARTGRDKAHLLGAAVRHYVQAEQRFLDLAEWWRRETGHLSSIAARSAHPAYQAIIRMGEEAIPLLLRELERRPDHWFMALHSITGDNPVPDEDAGRLSRMTAAWLEWGKDHGYA